MKQYNIVVESYNEPFFNILQRGWHYIPRPIRNRLKRNILKIKQKKYDCIFSIGDDCLIAQSLNELGIRNFSGPFDWFSGGDILYRLKLLDSKFLGFLEKENLQISEIVGDSKLHTYRTVDIQSGLIFPHDFFSQKIDLCFREVREKYDRRISRLYSKIFDSSVLIVYGKKEIENLDINNISKFIKKIRLENKCKRFDLLILSEGDSVHNQASVFELDSCSSLLRVELSKGVGGKDGWWYSNRKLHAPIGQYINTIISI